MKLYYHICQRPNFGDEINKWIWERIFEQKFDNEEDEYFVGIGTLINNKLPLGKLHIFGSGHGYGEIPSDLTSRASIHCVRGPLTAERLGISKSFAIADPAILLPKVHPLEHQKSIDVAFMPHIGIDSPTYKEVIEDLGITYLSPSEDEFSLLEKISKTKKLITSAMHGAIIADAYRTPWTPVVTSNEILSFKWNDWAKSLNLSYHPTLLPSMWDYSDQSLKEKFSKKIKSIQIKKSIKK